MSVRVDCRHYSTRTTDAGLIERCRLDVNEPLPFACPVDCVFFEPRSVSGAGWTIDQPPDAPPTKR